MDQRGTGETLDPISEPEVPSGPSTGVLLRTDLLPWPSPCPRQPPPFCLCLLTLALGLPPLSSNTTTSVKSLQLQGGEVLPLLCPHRPAPAVAPDTAWENRRSAGLSLDEELQEHKESEGSVVYSCFQRQGLARNRSLLNIGSMSGHMNAYHEHQGNLCALCNFPLSKQVWLVFGRITQGPALWWCSKRALSWAPLPRTCTHHWGLGSRVQMGPPCAQDWL